MFASVVFMYWQSDYQMVSDFTKKNFIVKANYLPTTKDFSDYSYTYFVTSTWLSIPKSNKKNQFTKPMLPWQPNDHTASNFTRKVYIQSKLSPSKNCHWIRILIQHFKTSTLPHAHTGQCKRTGGCYNELVVAFFSTGGGVKGKKIYTCWLYYLFINLHLFYLWWHLAHRPPVTLQFMALPSNWWYKSWFGLQIQQSSGVLPWQVLFSSVTA